jgi:peptidoglycan/xylan/chitin deacetylase (PgdA/CDA1 family)
MKRICRIFLTGFFIFVFFIGVAFCQQNQGKAGDGKIKKTFDKKICITFDNLPADRNYSHEERKQINEGILKALKNHNVPAVGFVIGDNIEGDWKILVDWLEEGHSLGFMTCSGQDVDNVPTEMFLADVTKGNKVIEDIVQSYKQKGRFFRFPFLHYGEKPEKKDEIEKFMDDYNIGIAHASIITEDFVYNLSLEKIINSRDTLKLLNLCEEYITHLLERLGYFESLAIEITGRPIRHILQLRANRLNSLFLDDVLSVIKEKGYKFISLRSALKDKVYQRPDAYYGSRGVSFLERIKHSDPDLLPAYE